MPWTITLLTLCALSPLSALTPQSSLDKLTSGNDHFVKGEITHLSYTQEAKNKLLEKQMPIAAILGCSDARVPPELLFDMGLGELFVVRDAGNVVGPIEMDSVEFAAIHLGVPLVIVMGHQNCGAIQATLAGKAQVPELDNIFPYLEKALEHCPHAQLIEAIHCNIRAGVRTLTSSPTLAPLIQQKKVQVIGAYFDFESGKVSWIEN